MPVYSKLCAKCTKEHRDIMKAIQSAILLNDIEVAAELCGRLAGEITKTMNHENQNCTAGQLRTDGMF